MQKGKLKIFFGYSAGVGKTYAMLKAAQDLKSLGIDVVIGYLEPHDRPETLKMAEGLERLPLKELSHGGILLKEFDVDAALARRPQLLFVISGTGQLAADGPDVSVDLPLSFPHGGASSRMMAVTPVIMDSYSRIISSSRASPAGSRW